MDEMLESESPGLFRCFLQEALQQLCPCFKLLCSILGHTSHEWVRTHHLFSLPSYWISSKSKAVASIPQALFLHSKAGFSL